MTILNDAQTFIGVLATFVVLCLFSLRGKSREDTESKNTSDSGERNDDSNFIYSLIRQVGIDSLQILKKRNEDLRKPYDAYYDKKGIDGKSKYQAALENADKVPDKNYRQLLMEARAKHETSFLAFTNNANKKLVDFEKNQRMGLKDELTFVSLIILIYIVLLMLIDVLSFISIGIRALVMNTLIACSIPFIVYLYIRFLKINADNSSKRKYHPWNGFSIVIAAIAPVFLWCLMSCFIVNPVVSLALFPATMGLFYVCFAKRLVNQMTFGEDFTRSFILRESVYIFVMAIAICAFFIIAKKYTFLYDVFGCNYKVYFHNWNNTIDLLLNPVITKYIVVSYFSLNVFILPILLGYIYIQRMMNRLKEEIDDMFESTKVSMQEAINNFESILSLIMQGIAERDSVGADSNKD